MKLNEPIETPVYCVFYRKNDGSEIFCGGARSVDRAEYLVEHQHGVDTDKLSQTVVDSERRAYIVNGLDAHAANG